MLYTQKTFNSHGPKRVDPRRDCKKQNHWPRVQRDGTYRCWFCQAPCQVDGTDAREET